MGGHTISPNYSLGETLDSQNCWSNDFSGLKTTNYNHLMFGAWVTCISTFLLCWFYFASNLQWWKSKYYTKCIGYVLELCLYTQVIHIEFKNITKNPTPTQILVIHYA
jgi:hypothetical protein